MRPVIVIPTTAGRQNPAAPADAHAGRQIPSRRAPRDDSLHPFVQGGAHRATLAPSTTGILADFVFALHFDTGADQLLDRALAVARLQLDATHAFDDQLRVEPEMAGVFCTRWSGQRIRGRPFSSIWSPMRRPGCWLANEP